MTVDNSSHQSAREARRLVRSALKGALATLDHRNPAQPYVSLVLVATDPDGTPLTLISNLAVHTRNLDRDSRASLLIDGTAGLDDPLTGARVTLMGRASPTSSATAMRRFLARHPSAQAYAGFPDFRPFALEIEAAHVIGGFGRIVDIAACALTTDIADAESLTAAEPELILQSNEQYSGAIAAALGSGWRISGIDPEGLDLLHRSSAKRLDFDHWIRTAAEATGAINSVLASTRA